MKEFKKFNSVEKKDVEYKDVESKDYTVLLTDLRSLLTSVALQAQTWHFTTKDPNIHSDLGEFYLSLIPKIDKIVETIQGRYSIITGDLTIAEFKEFDKKCYSEFQSQLEVFRTEFCSNVQNQIDEIFDITNKLMYKLNLNNSYVENNS